MKGICFPFLYSPFLLLLLLNSVKYTFTFFPSQNLHLINDWRRISNPLVYVLDCFIYAHNLHLGGLILLCWVISYVFTDDILLPDADVRYCVLESLDDSFDSHLAQAENLSALFVAMNDEVFEIRELAICTIGRLSSMNPAYVMPSLRKTLIQVCVYKNKSQISRR